MAKRANTFMLILRCCVQCVLNLYNCIAEQSIYTVMTVFRNSDYRNDTISLYQNTILEKPFWKQYNQMLMKRWFYAITFSIMIKIDFLFLVIHNYCTDGFLSVYFYMFLYYIHTEKQNQ